MIGEAAIAAILRDAIEARNRRYDQREAMRPLMPLYPGYTWAQIHRSLTVPACGDGKPQ